MNGRHFRVPGNPSHSQLVSEGGRDTQVRGRGEGSEGQRERGSENRTDREEGESASQFTMAIVVSWYVDNGSCSFVALILTLYRHKIAKWHPAQARI